MVELNEKTSQTVHDAKQAFNLKQTFIQDFRKC